MARHFTIKFKPRYVILTFLLTFFVLGGVYLSQQTRMESIAAQKAELQTQLDALNVEEERLDRMLEYMQTDEYLIQYCREKLGYVFADDIKFYSSGSTTSAAGIANTNPEEAPVATTSAQPSATPAGSLQPSTTPPASTTPEGTSAP